MTAMLSGNEDLVRYLVTIGESTTYPLLFAPETFKFSRQNIAMVKLVLTTEPLPVLSEQAIRWALDCSDLDGPGREKTEPVRYELMKLILETKVQVQPFMFEPVYWPSVIKLILDSKVSFSTSSHLLICLFLVSGRSNL